MQGRTNVKFIYKSGESRECQIFKTTGMKKQVFTDKLWKSQIVSYITTKTLGVFRGDSK